MSFLLPFNTLTGVLTIRGTHLGVGPSFGARRWDFYDIVALPMILTGLKLGLGVGLILVVAADFGGGRPRPGLSDLAFPANVARRRDG